MSVASGYLKYKRYIKQSDGTYKLVSHWTSSNTVEMNDGNTLETNLGAVKGVTSSLASTSTGVALSASAGKSLQDQITEIESNLNDGKLIEGKLHLYYDNMTSNYNKKNPILYAEIINDSEVMSMAKIVTETHKYLALQNDINSTYASLDNICGANIGDEYPTIPGIYRTTTKFPKGFPSGCGGYGILGVFGAGYKMHIYMDANSNIYFARSTDGNNHIPTTWRKLTTTTVDATV